MPKTTAFSRSTTRLIVIGVYLILSAIWCSHFFSFNDLGSHILQDGDGALNAWALNWVSRALTSDWSNLFNGNAFYPHSNSIALSEHMVGLAIFNIPVQLFTNNPWVGYNLLIFSAYFFSALGGYLFIQTLINNHLAAFWGGIFWGFCFFRIHHFGHLQILSYQWFPFIAAFLIKTRLEPTIKNALFLTLFFVIQALTSWYLAVIAACLVIILFLNYLTATKWTLKHTALFGLSGIFVLAASLPFALPYMHALTQSSLIDRLGSATMLGDQVKAWDFFAPPQASFLGSFIPDNKYWIWQENTLFIGYVPCLLSLIGLMTGWRSNKRLVVSGLSLIILGYLLAMGYVASGWNLHLPLYYLSSGFPFIAAIRATQRFALLVYFGILILSGLGAHYLFKRRHVQTGLIICSLLSIAFLIEVYPYQLPWKEIPPYTASRLDTAIATKQTHQRSPLIVLHYPIYTAKPGYPVAESKYMVDSTLHWAKILNGFSGAEPLGFHNDMLTLNTLPSQDAFDLLKKYQVNLLAIHKDLEQNQKDAIKSFFQDAEDGSAIEELGDDEYLVLLKR
jgi:hypothetical protein